MPLRRSVRRHCRRLARGAYCLDAKLKANAVAAAPDDKVCGAGLRPSGSARKNNVTGTTDWKTVSKEFEVGEDLREVELAVEFHSTAGSAMFELASPRV